MEEAEIKKISKHLNWEGNSPESETGSYWVQLTRKSE